MAELEKVIKLRRDQYNTLAGGGTVGDYTGLDDDYLYLIPDDSDLAPAYSTSSTYAVGDLCVYQGVLYQCTSAVSTAGAFNPSKWSQTTIAGAVLGLINTGM